MTTTDRGEQVAVSEVVRPLTATASRALAKLIDNDFENLVNEIIQHAEELEGQAEVKVKAEWEEKSRQAKKFKQAGLAAVGKYRQERERVLSQAREAGFEVSFPEFRYSADDVEVTVRGLDVAVRAARQKVQVERRRVLSAVERKRLEAQRKVLLATVTDEAEALLAALPSAREVFSQVLAVEA